MVGCGGVDENVSGSCGVVVGYRWGLWMLANIGS